MGAAKESSSNTIESEHCQPSTINQYCLNDQGGQQISVSENVSGTLRAQEHGHQPSVVYGISAYESNAMKSQNPNSGIYKADTTRTLDNNGGNPACNQGGMIVLEGNGSRPSHKGDGYAESDTSYTLNATERHAVCTEGTEPCTASKASFFCKSHCDGKAETLVATDYKDPQIVCYGLDRASFNQGQNAKYNFSVENDLAQTIVAKGPGGVLTEQ
jgi:DNA (cytosine-5)-methyltransferase 1